MDSRGALPSDVTPYLLGGGNLFLPQNIRVSKCATFLYHAASCDISHKSHPLRYSSYRCGLVFERWRPHHGGRQKEQVTVFIVRHSDAIVSCGEVARDFLYWSLPAGIMGQAYREG